MEPPSEVIVQLHNGEEITRTGVSDVGWSRVEYNGQTLYCISSYLLVVELKVKKYLQKLVGYCRLKSEQVYNNRPFAWRYLIMEETRMSNSDIVLCRSCGSTRR